MLRGGRRGRPPTVAILCCKYIIVYLHIFSNISLYICIYLHMYHCISLQITYHKAYTIILLMSTLFLRGGQPTVAILCCKYFIIWNYHTPVFQMHISIVAEVARAFEKPCWEIWKLPCFRNFFENDLAVMFCIYIFNRDMSIFLRMSCKIVKIETTKLSELQNIFSNVMLPMMRMTIQWWYFG